MATGDDRVGLLFWEMTLDDKEFKSKIKDSKKRLEGLDKDSKVSLGKLAGRFTLIAGAVAAVGIGLAKFTADTVPAIAEQKILADSIGATTAEIAGLEIASQKLGLESSQVIDKMREFGGITEFKKLADDVRNAGDATDQLNKSIEIFGGEGTKILPLLQLGSEGLKKFEEQAIRTGNALSPQATQKATEAWGEFQDLQIELKGATRELGVALSEFLPLVIGSVRLIRDLGNATGEAITGFNIWIDEIFGIEAATTKATTAEEIFAMKTARATKEALKQRDALKDLEMQAEKTFSADIFTQINLSKDLDRIRKALNLTEEGFKKVSSTVTGALGRNESALQIIKDLQATKGKLFEEQDFNDFIKKKPLDLGLFDQLDAEEKKLGKLFDQRRKKAADSIKALQTSLDPRKFANKALAGSAEAFRILQGQDTPAKETAKNTAKTNKLLEKIGLI